MKVFAIVNSDGKFVEYVRAYNERHALCVYLTSHDELDDMMLWKSNLGTWKLAAYDNEDEYLCAKYEWNVK